MFRINFSLFIIFTFLQFQNLFSQDKLLGKITGNIIDGVTNQPLIGANISIENTKLGSVTDENGNFVINNLPVGEYSLRTSMVGYKTSVLTNVVVSTGRSTKVKIRLNEEIIKVGDIVVQADYFSAEGNISPISAIGLNGAEIKRSPGAAQDMQRIVQNLPGIANSSDQTNELIVRGGAPDENLTIIDYMEIYSTNHFPNQFNSGGPINMINVDMIEDLRFSTGGFNANYGDKLSSVMDISLREGDREKKIAGQVGFSMAGVGTLTEGNFLNGKGTWIFSARQSLLEAADKIIGLSKIGLTAIPKYLDLQFKSTYDFNSSTKLIVNGIYGNDKILILGSPDTENPNKKNFIDSSGVENVNVSGNQYAVGVSLKNLWGTNGFSVLSLYTTGNVYFIDVNSDFMYREYDENGKVKVYKKINSVPVYKNDSNEEFLVLKYDAVYLPIKNHELNFGARIGSTVYFKNNIFFNSDTIRFDFDKNGIWDTVSTFLNADVNYSQSRFKHYKIGFYFSDKIKLLDNFFATLGLRYDNFTYSKQVDYSPRINLNYEFSDFTRFNFAFGEFYQTLPLPFYGDILLTEKNRYLKNSHAQHFVVGIEHIFDEGLKGSIEVYHKNYDQLPIEEQFIYSANKTFRSDKILSIGERKSTGIDFFIQQKQVTDYFGSASLTLSNTYDVDKRLDLPLFEKINLGKYKSRYDYPILFTLVYGKITKDLSSKINELPFYLKYPLLLFPISDDVEISVRYRISSGNVYTPKSFNPFEQSRQSGISWSNGRWTNTDEENSNRYNDYQRFDLQLLSRWHKSNYNIVVFMEIENLFNNKNIAGYTYNLDGTKDIIYQYGFFPVGGVQIEF